MSNRKTKLDGVHPALVEKILLIHHDMLVEHNQLMIVTDGVRTAEEQYELWKQGRTKPGRIVTQCDGYKKPSNHQPWHDKLGHAVDCCFIVDGKASWDEKLPWEEYGKLVEKYGLAWGGRWKAPKTDKPHVELLNYVEPHVIAPTITPVRGVSITEVPDARDK